MAGSKKEIGTGFITEVDRYLFNNGRHYEIFEKMGAHPKKYKGKSGMYFAVWAPHAEPVSYTHLDMYKRQLLRNSTLSFRGRYLACPYSRIRSSISSYSSSSLVWLWPSRTSISS